MFIDAGTRIEYETPDGDHALMLRKPRIAARPAVMHTVSQQSRVSIESKSLLQPKLYACTLSVWADAERAAAIMVRGKAIATLRSFRGSCSYCRPWTLRLTGNCNRRRPRRLFFIFKAEAFPLRGRRRGARPLRVFFVLYSLTPLRHPLRDFTGGLGC